ncbi:PREDICTED: coiled-coil domain-containing protein 17 [Calidris pugnax]|uniref:coiled-coil domain-containing protein 17 n=1 Tax=Calidris pugnax TaxID=198806 RepID=UPI00071DE393|nr:PREDICTED: coiled-coil domain-containing protein 17 [Calidris pugnax]
MAGVGAAAALPVSQPSNGGYKHRSHRSHRRPAVFSPPPFFLPLCLCEVGVSQHGDPAEPHRLLLLPGPPPAVRGQRGPGGARGAPLGDVLTPRERALLRASDPTSRRLPAEQGEPLRRPVPPGGHQELLEAHQSHVAEIRARTQQLEQQREGLCRRLAELGRGVATDPHPEREGPELSPAPQAPRDEVGRLQVTQGGAALHLDALLPAAGPLAAEARELRLSYLRGGGHDPTILAQLLQLQAEATVLEKGTTGPRRGRRPEPSDASGRGLDAALLAVELENQRLEDQLLALKVRRERRANTGSRVTQQHAEELAQLQAEVGMLRCHVEQRRPWLPPAILPPPVAPLLPPATVSPELLPGLRG